MDAPSAPAPTGGMPAWFKWGAIALVLLLAALAALHLLGLRPDHA